ncbi:type II toxin-antitoxin system HicA family toxin [Yinghuangia seranimata]|uniref:type II toxin-antitoxin system HicA family toxin n=1 Tax=Yinghuangia seranimata TaxID=408067 RepID=UPI00248B74CC|nr:type II toxin-antitoxin system HicA family toxin [Yinghuangia seranimata]MDI2126669.1 type II toxin-antitoxin system HicA family toxin [Yinghuangia seranimata]
MKRTDLVRQLRAMGAVFVRPGGGHDIYELRGSLLAVPRHREINELTAASILKKARNA